MPITRRLSAKKSGLRHFGEGHDTTSAGTSTGCLARRSRPSDSSPTFQFHSFNRTQTEHPRNDSPRWEARDGRNTAILPRFFPSLLARKKGNRGSRGKKKEGKKKNSLLNLVCFFLPPPSPSFWCSRNGLEAHNQPFWPKIH